MLTMKGQYRLTGGISEPAVLTRLGWPVAEVNYKTFVKRPVLAGNTARTLVPYASEVVVDADLAQVQSSLPTLRSLSR